MKYTAKVIDIGTSKYVIIPAGVRNMLSIKNKDMVEIDILKVNGHNTMKSYRCRSCQHRFDTDEDNPYCPACDCEDLEELK